MPIDAAARDTESGAAAIAVMNVDEEMVVPFRNSTFIASCSRRPEARMLVRAACSTACTAGLHGLLLRRGAAAGRALRLLPPGMPRGPRNSGMHSAG